MSRSSFKGPFFKQNLLKKKIINISRNVIILPEYLNKIFHIYNGNKFVKLRISDKMIGYRFGEFIRTRKICKHKKK